MDSNHTATRVEGGWQIFDSCGRIVGLVTSIASIDPPSEYYYSGQLIWIQGATDA